MPSHPLALRRLLPALLDTEPFQDYCRARGIPFDPWPQGTLDVTDVRQWAAAVNRLGPEAQARVEFELSVVGELAGSEASAHLLDVAPPAARRPPPGRRTTCRAGRPSPYGISYTTPPISTRSSCTTR